MSIKFKPPEVSKKQVNRAGDILKSEDSHSVEYVAALEVANQWRLAHIYPINTFRHGYVRQWRLYLAR